MCKCFNLRGAQSSRDISDSHYCCYHFCVYCSPPVSSTLPLFVPCERLILIILSQSCLLIQAWREAADYRGKDQTALLLLPSTVHTPRCHVGSQRMESDVNLQGEEDKRKSLLGKAP